MASVICCKCSHVIEVNGRVPKSCPACGFTLDIAADRTRTLRDAGDLPETIVATVDGPQGAFGRYTVERKLGSGGFGTVYLAQDPTLHRPVAIKIPDPRVQQTPAQLERFAREGRNAAQLRHPGIVSIYNVEKDQGQVFIVCEYVEGEPLAFQFRKGRMSFRAAASLMAALASAVEYAHSKGIIHRDIKPGNIMIDPAGNPRLMDFGLAKHERLDATVTINEQILGTPVYMSPEQARGRPQEIDRRTDIYSLGATFYHLLTNELPFHGDSREVREKVLREEPKRPRLIDKQIPADLETICLKAMEKDPAKRYQTARELADDLERWLRGEPIVARHINPFERSVRWCRRNPAPAGTVASVALLLIALTAGSGVVAAVQAVARRNADNARKEIEEMFANNQELLARAYGERGERHLRAAEFSDEHNPVKSLPWLLEAMKRDEENPHRLLGDRIRLQTLLDSSPRVERMWFFNGAVSAAGVSPKRDMLFIAGREGTVNIWKTGSDDVFHALVHPGPVSTAAFSPEGTRLATGSVDGLRIWETETGKCLKGPVVSPQKRPRKGRLEKDDSIGTLTFSKSGSTIFTSSRDGINQVWTTETGLPAGKAIVLPHLATAEFADSDRLLVVSIDGSTRVYDVPTGIEKQSRRGGKDPYVETRVGPDGLTIASCAKSGHVTLWNAVTGQTIRELAPDSAGGLHLSSFSPDGRLFTTGAEDGTVRMWNASNGQLLWRRQVFSRIFNRLQFSGDSAVLAVAKFGSKLCTLAAQSGKAIAEPIALAGDTKTIDWSPVGRQTFTVTLDGVARLWNPESRVPANLLPVTSAPIAAVSADRRVLAVAEPERFICILQSIADERLDAGTAQRFDIGDLSINALALTDDGSRIAVSAEGQVLVFDTSNHKQVGGPLKHAGNVTALRFTREGNRLVCVTYNGKATVWDITKGTKVHEPFDVSMDPRDIDIDREGKHCAVAAKKGVTVLNLASAKQEASAFLAGSVPLFARFCGDPSRVLTAMHDRPAQIWHTTAGQPLLAVSQRGVAQCVDVAADGKEFLIGYRDGTARLWFTANCHPASPPFEHTSGVRVGIIDPSGRFILTTTEDLQVFLWDAKTAELLTTFSFGQLQSQFGFTDRVSFNATAAQPLAFFARDSRTAYLLTHVGLLVTIDLDRDPRSAQQIAADATIRTGTEFDGAGGLRSLQPQELATRWKSIDHLTPLHSKTASSRTASWPVARGADEGLSEPRISKH